MLKQRLNVYEFHGWRIDYESSILHSLFDIAFLIIKPCLIIYDGFVLSLMCIIDVNGP